MTEKGSFRKCVCVCLNRKLEWMRCWPLLRFQDKGQSDSVGWWVHRHKHQTASGSEAKPTVRLKDLIFSDTFTTQPTSCFTLYSLRLGVEKP